jgi:D-alanine-D-alanine ligase
MKGRGVVVLFGGPSVEHEISVRSAASVIEALKAAGFATVPVGVSKAGRWWTTPTHGALLAQGRDALVAVPDDGEERRLEAGPTGPRIVRLDGKDPIELDVVFPVVHGTWGEDGTLQGLLESHGAPYVGAGVAASAICMDKILTKHVLQNAGIPVCRWLAADARRDDAETVAARIEGSFGYPCFVKPANSGSSVGISKVSDASGVEAAWNEATRHDHRIIVEDAIDGLEIECGVIGNERPEVSVMGMLTPSREFYDYEDKYVANATRLDIPASLGPETVLRLQTIAANAYRVLGCAGLARIDFFVERGTDAVYLNEPNTMPGFTQASMFPKLWQASGVPFPALVQRLVDLAHERHARRMRQRPPADEPDAVAQ